jgi:hypothetical protein
MYSDSVIDKCLLFALSNRGDTGKQGEKWTAPGPLTIFFKFSNSFVCALLALLLHVVSSPASLSFSFFSIIFAFFLTSIRRTFLFFLFLLLRLLLLLDRRSPFLTL